MVAQSLIKGQLKLRFLFIASAKIRYREGSLSPFIFHGSDVYQGNQ